MHSPAPHLFIQVVEVVVCRLTPLQQQLYIHFLESNTARRLLAGNKAAGVLSAITSLKKLCNHPKLIYDAIHSKTQVGVVHACISDYLRNQHSIPVTHNKIHVSTCCIYAAACAFCFTVHLSLQVVVSPVSDIYPGICCTCSANIHRWL